MKNIITTAALLFSMTAFAQVGINNTSPKATLDITAKTTDGSKPEGLIIPQLTGDKIRLATTATPTPVYGSNQKGLIIYATAADSAPAGATANITAPGYYYFDGSIWQKIVTGNTPNLYNADGTLTGTRTVNTAGNALKISGGGLLVVQTADNSGKIRLTPADTSHTGYMEVIKGDNTRLGYIGWDNTNVLYNAENGASHIFGGGNVGIGTSSPSAKLEINSGTANTSGLKFTNLNSASTSTSNASTLGVDNNGNVVVQSAAPVQTKFKSFSIDSNVATNSLVSIGSLEFRYPTTTCASVNTYVQVRSTSGASNLGIFHGASTDNQSASGFVNVVPTTVPITFTDLTSYPLHCVNDGHAQFSFFSYTDRTYYRVNVHIADGDSLGFGALGYIYVEYQK